MLLNYTLKMISLIWHVCIYIILILLIIISVGVLSTMVCVYQPDNFVELVLFCFYMGPGVVT